MTRQIAYSQAINEALAGLLAADGKVLLVGQGVTSPWYVGQTTIGLLERFGEQRIFDTPVSENAVTGMAVGAALAGMRPVVVHPRMDFMYYALDQIANHAANWHYMFGGALSVPITFWGIVNRGGSQGAQHSQSLQAVLSHFPGLKVVMPATPYDAKGLLVAAVRDDNPVAFIDDRWLYEQSGDVPEELYEVPLGKGIIRRAGRDVTIVATSHMVTLALEAATTLAAEGVDAEVLDPRTIKPLDEDMILASVAKTGRLVVADGGWHTCGFAAEVAALAAEQAFDSLKAPVIRVTLPDAPAPASQSLEQAYYPKAADIAAAMRDVTGK
ncbi:alpha-ketoacid dehydrogenase subunit beta [Chloroflexota bacterium]